MSASRGDAGESGWSVLLAGGTGLVGTECLRQLLADSACRRVVALVRRPGALADAAKGSSGRLEERVVDFDRLGERLDLSGIDRIVCALGTTIAKAGSRDAFRRVDLEYPLELARLGAARGVPHYLLVSAVGADARSHIFYSRVKGELEDALRALPFRSLSIARPSLLMGDRAEFRLEEAAGAWAARLLPFLFPDRYKPVEAAAVAAALVRLAREDAPGVRVVESDEIRAWARK